RGSHTITWAGRAWPSGNVWINTPTGTYTLQDNITFTTATFRVNAGTFNANGFNVQANIFVMGGGVSPTINMGSGTWTMLANGTPWNYVGGTINADTSTIVLTDASASTKTFVGGAKTYNNLSIAAGGTGAVNITGANTFNVLTINGPKTV